MADGVVQSLREHGEVRRGWVGLVTQDLTEDLAQAFGLDRTSGVLISDVFEDGPADRAGIQQGDLVLAVNGRTVQTSAQYRSRTERFLPGMDATLSILRDGAEREIRVPIERVPEEPEAQAFDMFESTAIPGLALATLESDDARRLGFDPRFRGVLVTDVADGSVADERGVRPGDVIREVARVRVRSLSDLETVLERVRGEQLLLLVQRGRQAYYVALPNSR
jgi:serine protease Do